MPVERSLLSTFASFLLTTLSYRPSGRLSASNTVGNCRGKGNRVKRDLRLLGEHVQPRTSFEWSGDMLDPPRQVREFSCPTNPTFSRWVTPLNFTAVATQNQNPEWDPQRVREIRICEEFDDKEGVLVSQVSWRAIEEYEVLILVVGEHNWARNGQFRPCRAK